MGPRTTLRMFWVQGVLGGVVAACCAMQLASMSLVSHPEMLWNAGMLVVMGMVPGVSLYVLLMANKKVPPVVQVRGGGRSRPTAM